MNLVKISASGFLLLTSLAVLFQFALAFGAPWGEYAMGGKYPGTFPMEMRIAAIIQGLMLIFMAIVVLSRAGLALSKLHNFSRKAVWVVAVYCIIGLFLNIITPSDKERMLWAPILFLNVVFSLVVALNKNHRN